MPLNAQGYFNCLNSYLNAKDYVVSQPDAGSVVLKEKIHQQQGLKPKEFKVTLKSEGEILVVHLDGKPDRLFHFLDDTAKPWSKRCDFRPCLTWPSRNCSHTASSSSLRRFLQMSPISSHRVSLGSNHFTPQSVPIPARKWLSVQ